MNLRTYNKKVGLLFLLVPLAFLPGCGQWLRETFGGKKQVSAGAGKGIEVASGDTVLVTLNGNPIITVNSLEKDFEMVLQENPQLKAFLPYMPEAKQNFLMGMVSQEVIDHYIAEQGIDQQEEYQKELASIERSLKRMLNSKYFGLGNKVDVSAAEVKKFYEENKESMPDLLVSRGGVKAVGLSFPKEAEAKAFADKAKTSNFTAAAVQAGLKDKINDFKLVNNQSIGVDQAVRTKIVSLKKFPALEVVKGDDSAYWVINATGSEEPKYRPFEQVEEGIKQLVEKEKRMKVLDEEIAQLKEKYNVKVNEDYFKAQQGDEQQPQESLDIEQLMPAQDEQARNQKQPAAQKSRAA